MNRSNESKRSLYILTVLISAIGAFLTMELGSFVALKYFVYPRDPSSFYEMPEIDRVSYELYLKNRHPTLGWPSATDSERDGVDSSGSRIIPSFPLPGDECVMAFGDSYIYGDEVEHGEAWSNILSSRLDCRVSNFGVPGYGTDQAFIRFTELRAGTSQLAILGIFPHNLMRNVNQYRYFLTGTNPLGFKPRFVLTSDGLTPVALPNLAYTELTDSFGRPEKYYQHEAFIPESALGPIVLAFPFTRALLKYVLSERVRYFVRGWPGWRGFVTKGHRSSSLETTASIVREFSETAAERGLSSLVVTFPTARSYDRFVDSGEIAYDQLLDTISTGSATVVDLHEPFRRYLDGRPMCELLTDESNCIGHFNAEGNEVFAEIVYNKIIADGLLSR